MANDASKVVTLKHGGSEENDRRLPRFIKENVAAIVSEWEVFARTLVPSAHGMTPLALRDHIHEILAFVVSDIRSYQTPEMQKDKSHGDAPQEHPATAAQTHAAVRLAAGFDIGQMASEYRALRASVLKLWSKTGPAFDAEDIEDMTRFNESIDQELAESVDFYTAKVAQSRELVVGILSHDLRGPLQAISLSAELSLRLGQLSDRQTMLCRQTLESANRMGKLISNLLDVTRARFGSGLPVVRAMMNIGFVAQQIVDEVRVVNPDRRIDVEMSGGLTGEWDKARIGQVFSNLLNNAVQYSFQGSPIRVDLRGDPRSVTLMVANAGVPIPTDKIGTIFDPLTRVVQDEHDPIPTGNLGLGLYITKEVIVAHGGTIAVSSAETSGTIFTVRIPKSPPNPAEQDMPAKADRS